MQGWSLGKEEMNKLDGCRWVQQLGWITLSAAAASAPLVVPVGEACEQGLLHPLVPAPWCSIRNREPGPLPGALLRPWDQLFLYMQRKHCSSAHTLRAAHILMCLAFEVIEPQKMLFRKQMTLYKQEWCQDILIVGSSKLCCNRHFTKLNEIKISCV